MVIVALIVLGLCLGSFVNAFVWRLHEQELLEAENESRTKSKKSGAKKLSTASSRLTAQDLSITKGRSMCVHCHHELSARDLMPVLSYVWLRGKCRYCHKPIDDNPLAELITPLLFVVSYVYWPYSLHGQGLFMFCVWMVFLVGFVTLALYDFKWFLLPERVVFPLIALGLIQVLVVAILYHGGWQTLLLALWGVLISSGLFYGLFVVSKGAWIGFGDVTLGIVLGLILGGPGKAFLLLFVASLLGTLVALPLLVTGKAKRGTHLPFGPFLLLAAIIVYLFGTSLIDWYTGQFLG